MTAPSSAEHRPGPSPLTVHLSMAALCLIWGSTWIVIRGGLRDLPPMTSAGVRFAVAWLVMLALAPALAKREGGERPGRGLVVAMGICNFALAYGIVYWSETILPSGLVSVLWSVFPMMMAVGGHLFLPGERLVARQWGGFLVGFGGVALLFSTDIAGIGPEAVPAALVLLVSPAAATFGTLIVKRYGARTSSVLLNRDGMFVSALGLLLAAFLVEHDADPRWTGPAILSVAYLALVGTVLTFGLYFWLMRYAPAYRLALIAYVVPAIALTLGATLGDESVGVNTVGGAALILFGVALVVAGKPRAPRAPRVPTEPEVSPRR